MLRLVFFLVVSCLLAWAAVWVVNHPGTVAVRWLDQELILSVGTMIAALLVFAAVVVILFELARVAARAAVALAHVEQPSPAGARLRGADPRPDGSGGRRSQRRPRAPQAGRALPAGQWQPAAALRPDRADRGREEVAHLKFRQMLDRRDAEFVGLRGLLAQSMKTGEYDEALALARRAYKRSPTTPWVLNTLFDLLARSEKWDEALPLVAEMQAQKLLDDGQARHKQSVIQHMLATRLRQQERLDDALAQARKAVKAAPGFAPAAVQAAELAQQQGRRRLALQVLENAWRAQPHPDLARTYAQLDPNETPAKRLQRVDSRLAPLAKSDTETLVLQAELAMQAGDWATARARLEAAEANGRTARVYRLLAELERQSGGDPAKAQAWLAKATDAEPDRAWVCEDTGEVLPAWQPFAPSGRFDAVQWTTPPRLATMFGAEQTTYILSHDEAPVPAGQPSRSMPMSGAPEPSAAA